MRLEQRDSHQTPGQVQLRLAEDEAEEQVREGCQDEELLHVMREQPICELSHPPLRVVPALWTVYDVRYRSSHYWE